MKKLSTIIIYILLTNIMCKIRFVLEIFRHGARSPLIDSNSNTDILKKSWNGDGELTSVGIRQHFLLGYRNRQKYNGFISDSYNPDELYVMSTNYNRTIMSVYSQLFGMFPPSSGPMLNDNQTEIAIPPFNADFRDIQSELNLNVLPNKSQVFPIHIIDDNSKWFNLHDYPKCQGVGEIITKNQKKENVKNFVNNFNNTYNEKLNKLYNISKFDFNTIYSIADSFYAGFTNGINYNEMINEGISISDFLNVSKNALHTFMFDGLFDDEDLYLGRMSMSPVFKKILEWMDTRINYDNKKIEYVMYKAPKMVLISGHDTNLSAMQAFIKSVFPEYLKKFIQTPYASSMFFEFHQNDNAIGELNDNDYYIVNIFNDQVLFNITYAEFKETVLKKLVSEKEIYLFCGFNENYFIDSSPLVVSCIILAVLCFILIIILIYLLLNIRKNKIHKNYMKLGETIL